MTVKVVGWAVERALEEAGVPLMDVFAARHHVRRWAEVVGYPVAGLLVHVPGEDDLDEAARRLVTEWTLAGRPVFTAEFEPYGTWEDLRRWVNGW